MKNIVRAFVAVLALTGSFAYTQMNTTSAKAVTVKPSGMPIPCCAPGDPDACGMGKR